MLSWTMLDWSPFFKPKTTHVPGALCWLEMSTESCTKIENSHCRVALHLLFLNLYYGLTLIGLDFMLPLACIILGNSQCNASLLCTFIADWCLCLLRKLLTKQDNCAAPAAVMHGSVEDDTMWSFLQKFGDVMRSVRVQTLLWKLPDRSSYTDKSGFCWAENAV